MKIRFLKWKMRISRKLLSLTLLLSMSYWSFSQPLTPQLLSQNKDTMFCFSLAQTKALAQLIQRSQLDRQVGKVLRLKMNTMQEQLKLALTAHKQQEFAFQKLSEIQAKDQNIINKLNSENYRLQRQGRWKNYLLAALFSTSATLILSGK